MQNQNATNQQKINQAVPLKGTYDLLEEVFRIFGRRWKTFVTIQIIPAVISLVMGIIGIVGGVNKGEAQVLLTIILLVLIVPVMFLAMWANYSLMVAVLKHEESRGWKDYYKDSLKIFWGILGVLILVGLVTVGGFFLLIIPGFVFAVWFGFAIWAYIEGGKGSGIVKALRESKSVVKGYFWSIVWRNFVFGSIVGLSAMVVYGILAGIGLGIGYLAGGEALSSVLANTLAMPVQVLVTPIFLLFAFLLYRHIKELKAQGYEKKKLATWVKVLAPIVILFLLIVPLALGVIAIKALSSAREKADEARETRDENLLETTEEVSSDSEEPFDAVTD